MKIDRSNLIAELETFARTGNGVVVGAPGVGKSYALAELREKLKKGSTPHLILPVERLGTGTDAELRAVLRREGDFVDLLRTAAGKVALTAVLIFDGFDAARGENERAGILRLISRAVNELRGQWNVVVSVRTFDARKSQRLLDLFPDQASQVGKSGAKCRQFIIPPLRMDELEQAFQQISGIKEIYSRGTSEFQDLLRVPFNLWLIERILRAGAKDVEFSQITSEVQLLEMYWDYRVRKAANAADREFLLTKATRAMVNSHTLAIRREVLYQPETHGAWNDLLSDEILTELTERDTQVAFSHNILFDFAVSAHLLEDDPAKLASFVGEEPARPLFLRPSLVYHFTRLWHFRRNTFWKTFWGVVQSDQIHLRQIIRLVLPAVVVNEAQSINDLTPVLDGLKKTDPLANDAVSFLLQAIRVLESPKRSLWASFLSVIGHHLNSRFAWDAGLVATNILDADKSVSSKIGEDCGDFARSLLGWAWESRVDKDKRSWFERLAGLIAIPLVAKTYSTNVQMGRKLFEKVISVIGEPDFPIDCVYRLTAHIELIIPHDAELTASIYERVFGYEEKSQATTHMGGHVLPLMSNRRQDFEMCQYCLLKEFSRFLSLQTDKALQAGIRSVQAFAIQDHLARDMSNGKTLDDLCESFVFEGHAARYVEDHSVIWEQTSYPDRELEIADKIFSWLADAARGNQDQEIEHFLGIFRDNACLAFLWARLLEVGGTYPSIVGVKIWELAKAKPFLEGNDTLVAIGAYLERVTESLSKEQVGEIEKAILELPKDIDEEGKKEFLEKRRNRLLARIPRKLLISKDALELWNGLEKKSALPPNEPLVHFESSWQPYTEEEFLREQGAKPETPANQRIRELYAPLKQWGEKERDESLIDSLVIAAWALRESLGKEKNADPPVLTAAWTHLAAFASDAVLRTTSADSDRFQKLRTLVLEAALHSDPKPNPKYDSQWDHASWSPAPRNEAAQALPWLTHFSEDREALNAIQKLANDPVPSVRFLLGCELWRVLERAPDLMWSIFDERVKKETNTVVFQGVVVSLWKLIPRAKDRSLQLIQKLLDRIEDDPDDDDEKARGSLICMVIDYAIWEDNEWAKSTLRRWQASALEVPGSIAVSGRRLIAYIEPQHTGPRLERAKQLLITHLDCVAKGLTDLRGKHSEMSQEDFDKKWKLLYGVIDQAVMRIYFAADINPDLRQRKENPLTDDSRKQFFHDSLPILEKVLSFGKQPETGMLLAPTANHFMELLNGVLRYDPPLVLRIATDVVRCSKRFNYNLDAMAMREVVSLVEGILVDYRDKVQEESSIRNLLELLDAFVEAGWPEALTLVWRLDEIYR